VGDLGRAIPLFERTLCDRERVLGSCHPDTLTLLSNLAIAHEAVGDSARAIPLFEHILRDCERLLGPGYPIVMVARANLDRGRRP